MKQTLKLLLLSLVMITSCDEIIIEESPKLPEIISFENESFAANYQIQGSKWDKCDFTYFISNFSLDMSEQEQIDGLNTAFDMWSSAVNFTFTRVNNSSADFIIDFSTVTHSCPSSPFEGGVIAHAFFPPPTNAEIAGDIHFNDEGYEFSINGSSSKIDFISVAVHEIGHSLGLGHSTIEGAVMFPDYKVDNRFRNLHQDDIDGIQAVYGAQCGNNNGGSGSGGGTSNTFTDSRDMAEYGFIKIGDQTWMTENLRYDTGNAPCYSQGGCETYGRYYSRNDVLVNSNTSNQIPSGVQGVCPNGWHLPSKAEWEILINSFTDNYQAYTELLSTGNSGFNAVLAGKYDSPWMSFSNQDERGYYWTSTEGTSGWGTENRVIYFNYLVNKVEDINMGDNIPCRCLKD